MSSLLLPGNPEGVGELSRLFGAVILLLVIFTLLRSIKWKGFLLLSLGVLLSLLAMSKHPYGIFLYISLELERNNEYLHVLSLFS